MAKKQISMRISDASKDKLDRLADRYGTQTTVIEIAIDRMYREEIPMTYPRVQNRHGDDMDYEAAVQMMDDDLREALHEELVPTTPQRFFDAYAQTHREKFGEDWILDTSNPVW